jgi:hypothetical protein
MLMSVGGRIVLCCHAVGIGSIHNNGSTKMHQKQKKIQTTDTSTRSSINCRSPVCAAFKELLVGVQCADDWLPDKRKQEAHALILLQLLITKRFGSPYAKSRSMLFDRDKRRWWCGNRRTIMPLTMKPRILRCPSHGSEPIY